MDKSFNDQELSDIMKEIEALEDDFKAKENEFKTSSPVIEELAHMEEEAAIPVEKPQPIAADIKPHIVEAPRLVETIAQAGKSWSSPVTAEEHHHKEEVHHHQKGPGHSAMSFKVSGDINLDLQFDIGGKVVELCVNETGLHITMEGGMTFNVPLNEKKKAA